MLRYTSFGSGSEGNALLVEASRAQSCTRILLDCGFSLKEIERRLGLLNLSISQLDAVLITHEHSDHVGSALTLAKRAEIPLLMSWGTALATRIHQAYAGVQIITAEEAFSFQDLDITPYTVPHDAREPLQFVFSDGKSKLGVLTDVGMATPHIIEMLNGCHGLVLECNYDPDLLAKSRYPASLKARISGALGHLSNQAAAEILSAIDQRQLKQVVAAHLSQQNNDPTLVKQALVRALKMTLTTVVIATQDQGFDWLTCE